MHAKFLPLPAFSLLFSPSALSALPSDVLVSFARLVLARLSPGSAPSRADADVDADGITQTVLERAILPCAAATSSIADNARVSVLAESLFRLYLKMCAARRSPELGAAVEKGVKAREAKAKIDRRKKDNSAEEKDAEWLAASGRRLRRLVEWVESGERAE